MTNKIIHKRLQSRLFPFLPPPLTWWTWGSEMACEINDKTLWDFLVWLHTWCCWPLQDLQSCSSTWCCQESWKIPRNVRTIRVEIFRNRQLWITMDLGYCPYCFAAIHNLAGLTYMQKEKHFRGRNSPISKLKSPGPSLHSHPGI